MGTSDPRYSMISREYNVCYSLVAILAAAEDACGGNGSDEWTEGVSGRDLLDSIEVGG